MAGGAGISHFSPLLDNQFCPDPIITRHGDEFVLPDYVNQKMVEVQLKLEELGLGYEIASEEFSPGKEKGLILNQYPIPGTKVKSERAIKFVISLGQKLVPIPELSGRLHRNSARLTG